MGKSLVEMAADIIQAQCSKKGMSPDEITASLQGTFAELQKLQAMESDTVAPEEVGKRPIPSPRDSIQRNKIICLECGEEFKILSSKHLSSHNLTGKEYRTKYGFKASQPLSARSLTEKRRKAAKKRGLPENLRKHIESRKKNGSSSAKPAGKTPKVKVRKKSAKKKETA